MQTRFLSFAYRYRYADGEYSATSQWSDVAFVASPFEFSINSWLNEGMTNLCNTAIITYNSGGPLVVGVDLLFKQSNNNVIKVIEKLDKSNLGLANNTDYTYKFTNSKIFTIISEAELLRLYDNVPRFARAQTIMGNRLMYGNYVEGYDMLDEDGNPVMLEYYTSLESNEIGSEVVDSSTAQGSYSINGAQSINDSIVNIDLTDVIAAGGLTSGSSITIEIRISHADFSGSTPEPTETTSDVNINFSFFLTNDYASVYDMANSTEFQNAVGTALNIKPVYAVPPAETSCDGNTFTDQLNCALPQTLDALIKFDSGITAGAQPISIISSIGSNVIGLQLIAMRYVDNVTTPTFNVYEYYEATYVNAIYQKIANPRSLHSNRGYEIGIVYMDEFNRATTALVSPNNTEYVPCSYSANQNQIIVNIPPTQKPPVWASRYKFVIKPDAENYETIYSTLYFRNPLTNEVYFLLEGENARKVEAGDRLIVKADSNGPTQSCAYATVLEKEAKAADFIEVPSSLDPTVNIPIPAGVYMKINPNSFSAVQDEYAVIAPGGIEAAANQGGTYPILYYPMNIEDPASAGNYIDYTVPAGSKINLNFLFERRGVSDGGCERRIYTLEKSFIASQDYTDMFAWWVGDNVSAVLNSGTQDVGGGGCPINNVFLPGLGIIPSPSLCTNYYKFYRDGSNNRLYLGVSGTLRCGGVLEVNKRRSKVTANIEVFRANNTIIFETEPSDSLPDVFFENNLSFPIVNGFHEGNVQNQTSSTDAIINTGFFNCFAFGNGAEGYKIRDSILGRSFNLGERVTSVSAQDYKEADRFSDITYSGVYNTESNVNKLNEFNFGLLNFKRLEASFGQIFILDGRETDVLSLQEDKISYVLAGKNLLSDSAAGGAITSVPEVLGTQIARTEKYGISFHPESYVQWGYDRFFTDVKRGAVIQLRGTSSSNEELKVVSENNMRTWFRDTFNESFNTQKLGGFDPYMNEYVLTTNDVALPSNPQCLECGITQQFELSSSVNEFNFCVDLGAVIGQVTISYEIVAGSGGGGASIIGTYNGVSVIETDVQGGTGTATFLKNSISAETLDMYIAWTAGVLLINFTVSCPVPIPLNVYEIVVNDNVESGKQTHVQYRYFYGAYTSPLQSAFVTLNSGTDPIVSRYNVISGAEGQGAFPASGSTVRMISNQIPPDDFVFDPLTDRFKYLRTNTVYSNTPVDINALLAAASIASPINGSGQLFDASFTMPSSGDNLYLIWEFKNEPSGLPIILCYDVDGEAYGLCCECNQTPEGFLRLSWDSIENAPVGDVNDVADWNILLVNSGTPFTSVEIDVNDVKLFGGANIVLKQFGLQNNNNIIEVTDTLNCIIEVSANCFTNCDNLISISLPSVAIIGGSCFDNCNNLSSVFLPSLTTAGPYSFQDCPNLTSISFPLLISAGQQFFYNCSNLSSVSLPSLNTMTNFVFGNCTNLTTISLPALSSPNGLGGSPGNNNVFLGITGPAIRTLTIPLALMTCNTGSTPDGDIQYLIANNPNLTIVTV
jgi:hypothetical protein